MKNDSEHLNALLEYLHDSKNGLEECAKLTKDPAFKNHLVNGAQERQNFISDIESLWNEEEQPAENGTLLGSVHRIYLDLKTKLSSDNKQAIKEEILRGEKYLIEKYNVAIKETTSNEIKDVLNLQIQKIHEYLVNVTRSANEPQLSVEA